MKKIKPKNKISKEPNFTPLDEYEKELEDALNKGEFVRAKNFEENKKMFEEAARNYLKQKQNRTGISTFKMSKRREKGVLEIIADYKAGKTQPIKDIDQYLDSL